MNKKISVIIPARDEEEGLRSFLPLLRETHPDYEIVVVDDGSTDGTVDVCKKNGVTVVSHPYSMGNGAAIKTGARNANGEIFVFMDGDGQHNPNNIASLLAKMDEGYDMVVGARTDKSSQANIQRHVANGVFNLFAGILVGREIPDLTSGFRAVKSGLFLEFLSLLPNGFSYPTTITMAFFRSGYSVAYIPIFVSKRLGDSHIKPVRDGFRFLLIMTKMAAIYSPMKLFVPMSLFFFTTGFFYYIYTYVTYHSFTNMGALFFITSILIFLIGLVSEQITNLMYISKHK